MLPGSNLGSPLCSSGEETALYNSMHNSILKIAALNAVINPVAQIQLYFAAPLLTPPRPPLAPLPHLMAHRRAPQLPQRSTWLYLAAARLRPTAGLSHLRPTSGLASQSTPRAHTLAGRHSRSAPAPILFRRPRLFSSDACGALHLVEGKAPVLRVLTGRAGRVAAGQVALDLVLR